MGSTPEAKKKFDDCWNIIEEFKIDDLSLKSHVSSNIGRIYAENNEYEKAIEKFKEANELSVKIDDKKNSHRILENLNRMLENLNQIEMNDIVDILRRYGIIENPPNLRFRFTFKCESGKS